MLWKLIKTPFSNGYKNRIKNESINGDTKTYGAAF
jgi:hypothetical protein